MSTHLTRPGHASPERNAGATGRPDLQSTASSNPSAVRTSERPGWLRRPAVLVPLIVGLLAAAGYALCPTPQSVQGEMWSLRSQVLEALRADDRAAASVALAAWENKCRQLGWLTLIHEARWRPEERAHLQTLADQLSALQTAINSGAEARELQTLALNVFDSHRHSASDDYLRPELPPAKLGAIPACCAGHKHAIVNLPPEIAAPTLTIEVLKDPKVGWNLKLTTTNFEFAPEHASLEHRPGEGHGHLYVDGRKIARLYSNWFYLGDLDPGEHFIHVTLNSNDHNDLAIDGKRIEAMTKIEVPDTRFAALFGTSADNSEPGHGQ